MQKAYVDFAMDCFRTQAEIQSNPEQPETSQSSRIPTPMVQVGVRGESQRLLRHSATVFAP